MNIPPMPKWPGYDRDIADPHTRECHYADALCDFASHLESLCKQGWAEAERLEAEKESHEDAHWYEVGQNNALRSQLDACYAALGTTFYMDPPDGGDPGVAVMVGRMKAHRDELIATVRELAEALEVAQDAMDERRSYVSGGEPSTCWQEMKYGKIWDEEDAKVSAALSRLASAGSK